MAPFFVYKTSQFFIFLVPGRQICRKYKEKWKTPKSRLAVVAVKSVTTNWRIFADCVFLDCHSFWLRSTSLRLTVAAVKSVTTNCQNQNLSKNITLCCAQERKVRFYPGNTQKKSVLQTSTQTESDGPSAFESRGVANRKSDEYESNTSANCAEFWQWPL